MALVDIEANGLYDEVTKIHCLSYTLDGEPPTTLFDYQDMRNFLSGVKVLIGHDLIRYDLRVLEKILQVDLSKVKVYDTLAMSWYYNTDRVRHGLESFGEDYGIPKPKVDDWHNLTPEEYAHRCSEDVKINWRLWKDLIKNLLFLYKDKAELDRFLQYLSFKMKCAAHQSQVGWKVDLDLVERCIDTLTRQQEEKVAELIPVMPPHKLYKKVKPPKNPYKQDGTPSVFGDRWFALMDELGLDRTHNEEVKVPNGTEPANPTPLTK